MFCSFVLYPIYVLSTPSQCLLDEAYYSQPISLRHPIVFYDGHLPGFSFNTLVKKALGGASIDPVLETLFARGIDPDESGGTPDVSAGTGADSAMNGTSGFAEAATVSFSVVQNRPGLMDEHRHGDEYQGAEQQGGGAPVQQGDAGSAEPDGEVVGNHPAENHGTRPDKDV